MKLFKRIKLNSKGFSHVEAVLAVVIIATVAAVGVRVIGASHALAPSSVSTGSTADESQEPENLNAIINQIQSSKTEPLKTIPASQAMLPQSNNQVNLNSSTGNSQTGAVFNSPNWSGYLDNSSDLGPYNQVSGDMVVPKPTCTIAEAKQKEYTLFWVGFDGYNLTNYGGQSWSTVEQDGIWMACAETKAGGTVPVFGEWWEMYPTNDIQARTLAMKPGDTINMKVNYTSTGVYQFRVTNVTTGKSLFNKAVCGTAGTCGNGTAEWIAERSDNNGQYSLLINWHTITFTNATAGVNVTNKVSSQEEVMPAGDYPNLPIDMYDIWYTPPILLAKVQTSLNNNDSFSDTWHASQ